MPTVLRGELATGQRGAAVDLGDRAHRVRLPPARLRAGAGVEALVCRRRRPRNAILANTRETSERGAATSAEGSQVAAVAARRTCGALAQLTIAFSQPPVNDVQGPGRECEELANASSASAPRLRRACCIAPPAFGAKALALHYRPGFDGALPL